MRALKMITKGSQLAMDQSQPEGQTLLVKVELPSASQLSLFNLIQFMLCQFQQISSQDN